METNLCLNLLAIEGSLSDDDVDDFLLNDPFLLELCQGCDQDARIIDCGVTVDGRFDVQEGSGSNNNCKAASNSEVLSIHNSNVCAIKHSHNKYINMSGADMVNEHQDYECCNDIVMESPLVDNNEDLLKTQDFALVESDHELQDRDKYRLCELILESSEEQRLTKESLILITRKTLELSMQTGGDVGIPSHSVPLKDMQRENSLKRSRIEIENAANVVETDHMQSSRMPVGLSDDANNSTHNGLLTIEAGDRTRADPKGKMPIDIYAYPMSTRSSFLPTPRVSSSQTLNNLLIEQLKKVGFRCDEANTIVYEKKFSPELPPDLIDYAFEVSDSFC